MLVAIIRSINVPKEQFGQMKDGAYTSEVVISLVEARQSGDPQGFAKKEVARHLAGCVHHTGLPLGFQCWQVEFTVQAQTMFNFPAGFTT